jgi:hypothetical protein
MQEKHVQQVKQHQLFVMLGGIHQDRDPLNALLARSVKPAPRQNQQSVQFVWQENLQQQPTRLNVDHVSVVSSKNLQMLKNVLCVREAGQQMLLRAQHAFNVKNDGGPQNVKIQDLVLNFVFLAF